MNQAMTPCSSPSKGSQPIPYGLKDGRMLRVQDVPTGLKCGCVCAACGHPLVAKAKDSKLRRPHFAHFRDAECRAGYETSVHKAAKQLIAHQLRLCLPEWDGEPEMPNPPRLRDANGQEHPGRRVEYPPEHVRLDSAVLEKGRGDYIPDVTAAIPGGELLIEIRVSHAVDSLKRSRVQSEAASMVEIDLSRLTLDQALDEKAFEKAVLDTPENRYWLSCPAATEAWRVSRQELKIHVLKINRKIAEEQTCNEARKKALAALEKVKAQRKESYREQLRMPFQKDLDDLPRLVSPEAIMQRLARFAERDRNAIAEGLEAIENRAIRAILSSYHPDAWVYSAHPVLWQLSFYRQFIQNRASGFRFNQRDVASWVKAQYGVEPSIYKLFIAQYKARSQARIGGYKKKRISAWYFSGPENAAIPNVYHPVNWIIEKLLAQGTLAPYPGEIGDVVVRLNKSS